MSSSPWAVPSLPGPLRLVDVTLRRVDRVPVRHAGQRDRRLRPNLLQEQDGRPQVPRMQLGRG